MSRRHRGARCLTGCHLLLDKPLTLSADEADGVVAAVDKAAVASRVFFTRRFPPEVEDWLAARGARLTTATAVPSCGSAACGPPERSRPATPTVTATTGQQRDPRHAQARSPRP